MAMSRAAIVGAGLIGRSWAMVFARAGWDVALYDPVEGEGRHALELIPPALAEQECYGLVGDAAAALGRISIAPTLEAALADAALVQERARAH